MVKTDSSKQPAKGGSTKQQSLSLRNDTINILEKEAERRGVSRSKLVDSVLFEQLATDTVSKPTIVAVMSYKGGVAKTTTSACLAICLSEAGKRVLIVDLDGQGNISQYFRVYDPRSEESCIADVLDHASTNSNRLTLEEVMRETDYENVYVVPSNFRFSDADAKMKAETAGGIDTRLRYAIEDMKENFDYIIIDCGPRLDMTTTNAIVALEAGNHNSHIIIPVKLDGFAMAGVSQTVDLINRTARERRMAPQPWIILRTVVERNTSVYKVGSEELKNTLPNAKYFNTIIDKATIVPESSLAMIPLVSYEPDSKPSLEYRMLAQEIEDMNE